MDTLKARKRQSSTNENECETDTITDIKLGYYDTLNWIYVFLSSNFANASGHIVCYPEIKLLDNKSLVEVS